MPFPNTGDIDCSSRLELKIVNKGPNKNLMLCSGLLQVPVEKGKASEHLSVSPFMTALEGFRWPTLISPCAKRRDRLRARRAFTYSFPLSV